MHISVKFKNSRLIFCHFYNLKPLKLTCEYPKHLIIFLHFMEASCIPLLWHITEQMKWTLINFEGWSNKQPYWSQNNTFCLSLELLQHEAQKFHQNDLQKKNFNSSICQQKQVTHTTHRIVPPVLDSCFFAMLAAYFCIHCKRLTGTLIPFGVWLVAGTVVPFASFIIRLHIHNLWVKSNFYW